MEYYQIGHIFFVGLAILLGAILINGVAIYFNISTWYSFASNISEVGFLQASKDEGFFMIWLFLIYPLILGLIGYYAASFFVR